jgi:predicted enzyme related to lactoylglutathione lyase
MMIKNPVIFWELASNDAEKSVNFFKSVFDWDVEYDEGTGIYYIPVDKSSNDFRGGGIFTLKRAKLPFLTIYIYVDDIEAYTKKVKEFGGLIVDPPQQFTPDGPKICLFNDPSGVTFSMQQSRLKEK